MRNQTHGKKQKALGIEHKNFHLKAMDEKENDEFACEDSLFFTHGIKRLS